MDEEYLGRVVDGYDEEIRELNSDVEKLTGELARLTKERDEARHVLGEMRPVWADASIVGCLDTALAGLWKELGAVHQTDAMQKLRGLKSTIDALVAALEPFAAACPAPESGTADDHLCYVEAGWLRAASAALALARGEGIDDGQ